jgi:peroxiredoxin
LEEYQLDNDNPAKKLLRITSLSGPPETEKNEWFIQQQNSLSMRFRSLPQAWYRDSMTKYFDPLLEDYIINHPNSKLSAYISIKAYGKENRQRFLSLVNRELTKDETRRFKADEDRENVTKIGATIGNFNLKDLNGKTISLNSISAKYILLDFWASWCVPCRLQHPELVNTYNTFHKKGFEIVSISLDESKADWRQAVKKDKLSWIHVSDLKSWESPLAKRFSIYAMPFNILIDQNRKIIATHLDPAKLLEKLDELLKQ